MRVKHDKKIKLGEVDDIWNDWLENYLYTHLIKYGKVQVDKNFSIEIVGERKNIPILIKETGTRKLVSQANLLRPGVIYSIVLKDKSFKGGKLIFHACPRLKELVSTALKTTTNYYRIENEH